MPSLLAFPKIVSFTSLLYEGTDLTKDRVKFFFNVLTYQSIKREFASAREDHTQWEP